jgi:ABC-type branched-subunit amino acid transport system substrate-binding protein
MFVAGCKPLCDPRRPPVSALLRRNRLAGLETIGFGRTRDPLRIALLLPLSGPAGMWGPSCRASALLAQGELNAAGGILGREVELVFQDAGGDPEDVAEAALSLIEDGEAAAVIGMHISAVRLALVRALGGRIPYVYTPVYEGGETAPGVFMTGETPSLQLRPAINWLEQRRNAQRWYLVGTDYVWPRVSHRAARRYVKASGGAIVGEEHLAFGTDDFGPCLDRIRRARPDAVLVSMVGGDCVAFNRAFAEAGLARHVLRLSMASEENTLLGIGAENAENLFFSAGYLSAMRTPENLALLERYRAAFGENAPVLNTIGQSCYEGLRLFAAMAQRAGAFDVASLTLASEGLSYMGPRGKVGVEKRHLRTAIYLAEADGLDFRIIERFAA